MSWVDKDDAFNKLNKEKTDLLNQDQSNLKLLQNKYDALNAQCEYKDGVVDTLGKQNRDQQNTINNCQTQALKLITPTPWQYTTLPLNPFPPNNSKKWISYVSVSNKTVTPFFMDVKCDQPISDPQGYVLNNQFMGYGGAMNADGKGFNFAISFPAWGPNSPIAIQFSYVGEKIPVCTFNAR